MTTAQTPDALLRAVLGADPARPLLTFYDDATGERVELSGATFANWVAKTANLLQDELSAAPGDRVALLLPAHWQTVVWLHACWAVGAVAAPGADPAGADLVVSGPGEAELMRARACSGERVALALRPLGGRFPQPPAGFLDYGAEVPGQGDRFAPYAPVGPADPALELPGEGVLDGAETVRRARDSAHTLGVGAGARVMSARSLDTWDGLAAGWLAPLASLGSAVLVRHIEQLTDDQRKRREETEQTVKTFL